MLGSWRRNATISVWLECSLRSLSLCSAHVMIIINSLQLSLSQKSMLCDKQNMAINLTVLSTRVTACMLARIIWIATTLPIVSNWLGLWLAEIFRPLIYVIKPQDSNYSTALATSNHQTNQQTGRWMRVTLCGTRCINYSSSPRADTYYYLLLPALVNSFAELLAYKMPPTPVFNVLPRASLYYAQRLVVGGSVQWAL